MVLGANGIKPPTAIVPLLSADISKVPPTHVDLRTKKSPRRVPQPYG
jgi:hypothetical protein